MRLHEHCSSCTQRHRLVTASTTDAHDSLVVPLRLRPSSGLPIDGMFCNATEQPTRWLVGWVRLSGAPSLEVVHHRDEAANTDLMPGGPHTYCSLKKWLVNHQLRQRQGSAGV